MKSRLAPHSCRRLSSKAFSDSFYKMRGRLSEDGFEESFQELVQTYPKAEEYLLHLYKDRERWAVAFSVLTFSVSSFTTNRVEGRSLTLCLMTCRDYRGRGRSRRGCWWRSCS